LGRQI